MQKRNLGNSNVDPEVPIEDVAGAVKDLIDEGKVKHWAFRSRSRSDSPRSLGSAHHRAAKRMLFVVARAGSGNTARP
jgi:aryl-alcohol dehydrogenase-like predicted oxidoreductase